MTFYGDIAKDFSNARSGRGELVLPVYWEAASFTFMSEIIFEVREDDVAGGYLALALGFGIHTEAETLEELRGAVREAVDCYFDEMMDAPKIIRLHFVHDEVLAR